MRAINTKHLILLADSQRDRFAISRAIAESVEIGVVVPSILRSKLEALGLTITETKVSANVRVDVLKGGELLARGSSSDTADALLHAMLGFVRELNIDGLMATGMSKPEAVAKSVGGSAAVK